MYHESVTHRVIRPDWLAELLGGVLHPPTSPATDLIWDSRLVQAGSLFVALPGRTHHGRIFAQEALKRGAAFVLTDASHPSALQVADPYLGLLKLGAELRREFARPVVAVGGSSGKTSTKEALAQALGWPAPPGNLNTAPALARFFFQLDAQAPGAVVELGIDRPGEMAELQQLSQPTLALITALGPEHLEGFGSLERALEEEARLLATPQVLLSEQAGEILHQPAERVYGFKWGAFRGENLRMLPERSYFRYRGLEIHVPYPGQGPALAALAALAAGELLGAPLEMMAERLGQLQLPSGRMERLVRKGIWILHDAYNANPLSVLLGLEFLAQQEGTKWLVLGEMKELGSEARRYHLEIARRAAQISPHCLFLGSFAKEQAEVSGGTALNSLDELREALQAVRPGQWVYLKASRSLGLERILEVWP